MQVVENIIECTNICTQNLQSHNENIYVRKLELAMTENSSRDRSLNRVSKLEQSFVHLLGNLVVRTVTSLETYRGGFRVQILELVAFGRPHPRVQITPEQQHWAGKLSHKLVDCLI